MEINISIGKRLLEERELLGKSQSEFASLAAAAGVPGATRQSQAKYEKGLATASAPYMAAIAAAGVDVLYILTGERDPDRQSNLNAQEQTLLDYFRQASAEVRRAALGALLGASVPVAKRSTSQVFHGNVHGEVIAGNKNVRIKK